MHVSVMAAARSPAPGSSATPGAERDALQLKADALAAAGNRDGAHAARREAEATTRRLIPADLDLRWVRA